MKLTGRASRRVVITSSIVSAGVVLIGMVPWRLVAAEPKGDEKVPSSVTKKSVAASQPLADSERAAMLFRQLEEAHDWRERDSTASRLANMGPVALPRLLEGTKSTEPSVRQICLQMLRDHFRGDPKTFAACLNGLKDSNAGIAYECAFFLGEAGNKAAVQPLRELLKRRDSMQCYTAAKSLAELGEKDVIVTLYWGLGDDNYMPRMLCNLGIRALTGKDLSDFHYDYREGAFVSGGNEYKLSYPDPIKYADLRVSRFQAMANFCRWLRDEKPQLFALFAPKQSAIPK
jgi:hypothetical protein